MSKGCIFCGKSPTTLEHLFPQWMRPVLAQDPRGLSATGRQVRRVETIEQTTEHTWESKAIIDFKVNCVCGPCNNGWMSRIESAAQPVLSPMILGANASLDRHAQEIVGMWSALKAVVFRYAHQPIAPVPRDWLDYFHQHHEPPKSWSVWVARYIGSIPARYEGRTVNIQFPRIAGLTHAAPTFDGILATILVGQFVAQVFGVNWGAHQGESSSLFRVWPAHPTGVAPLNWPPSAYLDDAGLKPFGHRLLTEIES